MKDAMLAVTLIAIGVVWAALVLLFLAACRMAAQGDGRRARPFPVPKNPPESSIVTAAGSVGQLPVDVEPVEEHPLELLLQDRRESSAKVTGRAFR